MRRLGYLFKSESDPKKHFCPAKEYNLIRSAFQRIFAERQSESRFRVIRFVRDVTVDDGGNYVTFHELNVRINIKNK